jgi:hypothetical protein
MLSPAHRPQYYVRSTKLILPSVFNALRKGSDPDRMKGALYILWSKGIGQVFSCIPSNAIADLDAAVYAVAGKLYMSHSLVALIDLVQRP